MRIEDVFAAVLKEPAANLDDETSPKTLRRWDSLRHIELILTLESTYGVAFSPAEAMTISSLGAARNVLRQKGIAA